MLGPHVEQHGSGIPTLETVAIYTVVVGKLVLIDRNLGISLQIPLVDTHLIPEGIGGLYKSVCDIRVNLFFCHMHGEWRCSIPFTALFHT